MSIIGYQALSSLDESVVTCPECGVEVEEVGMCDSCKESYEDVGDLGAVAIAQALRDILEVSEEVEEMMGQEVQTVGFREGEVLTNDAGFTIVLPNGQEYQVTIVQSGHSYR